MPQLVSYADFKTWIDTAITEDVATRIATLNTVLNDTALATYINHSRQLLADGKRVRPYLAYLGAYDLRPCTPDDVKHLALGFEYFHAFCLVHDDIMDAAVTRRGIPTIQALAGEHLDPSMPDERKRRVSEGIAILIGDILYAWAMDAWRSVPKAVHDEVFTMIAEVTSGQLIDIWMSGALGQATEERINKKMALKTASYTFVRPFRAGLAYHGASPDERTMRSTFAMPLGLAFQAQDDYLDLAGDPQKTGKPRLNDIREGQPTYFSQLLQERMDNAERAAFDACFGEGELTAAESTFLAELLSKYHVAEDGKRRITEHFSTTQTAITTAPLSPPVQQALTELTQYIAARAS